MITALVVVAAVVVYGLGALVVAACLDTNDRTEPTGLRPVNVPTVRPERSETLL